MKLIKKKSLGQHFLSDKSAVSKIVNSADIKQNNCVLEIGPGAGAITNDIYSLKPKRLVLIEKDKRFYEELLLKYPDAKIMNYDAADFDFCTLKRTGDEFTVVGNLPYNVSTVILERLVAHKELFSKMILMFQKEVAERILALPNSSEYGRLSLLVEEFYEAKKVFALKPGSFSPPPKVDSMVVVFNRLKTPKVEIKDRTTYDSLLKLVFSQRRKMLRRSLRSMLTEQQVIILQDKTGIDLQKRPQELDIKMFADLSDVISKIA